MGTDPTFIRSVPKEDHRRLWTLFYGKGQVSFTRKNVSEPFQFLSEPFHFFRSCKRPLDGRFVICTTGPTGEWYDDRMSNLCFEIIKHK